jgi:hypothetical protein
MPNLVVIVQHTPLWVFALLAVLVVFGIQALRPRTVPVWRLFIVPAVFIGWGVISLLGRAASSPLLGIDWLVTAAIGIAIARLTTRLDQVEVDRAGRRVRLPGSAAPLVRYLAIFTAKYGLTAAMAVAPALRGSLVPWDIAVSGLAVGYFVGWLFLLLRKYRAAEHVQPALPAG